MDLSAIFEETRQSIQVKLVEPSQEERHYGIGRRETLKTHNLPANSMQMWLGQFDRGKLDAEDAAASTIAEYEAHIAALERKADQMERINSAIKSALVTALRLRKTS